VTALTNASEASAAADCDHASGRRQPQAAQAVAQAASDTLAAVAAAVEGRRGGPLTRAVDLFDKATRQPRGRAAAANTRSANLRAMSRLVHLMGQMADDKDTFAMLALLLDLARLSDTVAMLRDAQQRHHQAEAARTVAAILRGAATTGGRLGPAAEPLPGSDLTAGHMPPSAVPTTATTPQQSRGTVTGLDPAGDQPVVRRPRRRKVGGGTGRDHPAPTRRPAR
jgi:hypothetical protein